MGTFRIECAGIPNDVKPWVVSEVNATLCLGLNIPANEFAQYRNIPVAIDSALKVYVVGRGYTEQEWITLHPEMAGCDVFLVHVEVDKQKLGKDRWVEPTQLASDLHRLLLDEIPGWRDAEKEQTLRRR